MVSVRDITKISGYPRSNVKTRLEQSNYFLASGRFPLQNAIYDNKTAVFHGCDTVNRRIVRNFIDYLIFVEKNLQLTMQCLKGGFMHQRHDIIRDTLSKH